MASKRKKSSTKHAKDAIALLKADHRQVESWFDQFEKAKSSARKGQLANTICEALIVHTEIEEEIFYPAFLQATEDKDLHHEAVVEHAGAKNGAGLVAQRHPRPFGDQGMTDCDLIKRQSRNEMLQQLYRMRIDRRRRQTIGNDNRQLT